MNKTNYKVQFFVKDPQAPIVCADCEREKSEVVFELSMNNIPTEVLYPEIDSHALAEFTYNGFHKRGYVNRGFPAIAILSWRGDQYDTKVVDMWAGEFVDCERIVSKIEGDMERERDICKEAT